MKKYLFLLFLFFVYIVLVITPKTKEVILYDDISQNNVILLSLEFKKGINSNDLNKLFELYEKEYLITRISTNKKDISVSCDEFNKCINDIYEQMDNKFEEDYLVSGFKINSISIISSKDYVTNFFANNDVIYGFY